MGNGTKDKNGRRYATFGFDSEYKFSHIFC